MPTDADCYPAIQAEINAVELAGGGDVVLPYRPGGYGVSATPLLGSRVRLAGTGMAALRPLVPMTYLVAFRVGSSAASVEGLTLAGEGRCAAALVSAIGAMSQPKVTGCALTDVGHVADHGVQVGTGVAGAVVDDNNITDLDTGVLVLNNNDDTTVSRNRIRGWRNRGVYVLATKGRASTGLTLDRNDVRDMAAGGVRYPVLFSSADDTAHRRPAVTGNTVVGLGTSYDDPTSPGTADQISLSHCRDFRVVGNTSIGGGDMGITVALSNARGIVSENHCHDNDVAGIDIGDPSTSFDYGVAVTGNVCFNNGRNRMGENPPHPRAGIYAYNARGLAIAGNVLGNDDDGTDQQYGVSTVGCANVEYGANVDVGNRLGLYRTA